MTETTTFYIVEHYNDPATTTRGYEGWHGSNRDLFPREAYEMYNHGSGFATLEDGLYGIEIIRTRTVNKGYADRTQVLAFGACPLRLVKVITTITREIIESGP